MTLLLFSWWHFVFTSTLHDCPQTYLRIIMYFSVLSYFLILTVVSMFKLTHTDIYTLVSDIHKYTVLWQFKISTKQLMNLTKYIYIFWMVYTFCFSLLFVMSSTLCLTEYIITYYIIYYRTLHYGITFYWILLKTKTNHFFHQIKA